MIFVDNPFFWYIIISKGGGFVKETICHYIPYHKDYHSIHTINFVYETNLQLFSALKSQSVYKMHFVCSGTGRLHMSGRVVSLSRGDVFFTFPATPFCIESEDDFTYMYISYLGTRATNIMDKLKISSKNFHFGSCIEIYDFWKTGINSNPETTDLISESILLYSFHYLASKIIVSDDTKNLKGTNAHIALKIKKYIDDNFSSSKLTLENIGHHLSYSPKYVSTVFKKKFKVGITDYLNTIRIQNACTLINQGYTSISDISYLCGYSNPQYFSKIFKCQMGVSPKEYIKNSDKFALK